jgi:uncharacterized Tic20 family protein
MRAPDDLLGQIVQCLACAAKFRVPAAPVPVAAPAVQTGIRQGPAAPPAGGITRPPSHPTVLDATIEERLEEVPDEEEIADVLPAEQVGGEEILEVEEVEDLDDLEVVAGKRPKKKRKKARGMKESDCTLAMLMYLSSFLFGFLGPLIIWLIKRAESEFIDYHGKSALNFIFSVGLPSVGVLITGVGIMISVGGVPAFGIWMLMLVILSFIGLYSMVMIFVGALKAKDGEWFELPTWIRLFQ